MTTDTLAEKTVQDLQSELIELRQEQLRIRMQRTAGESAPKPHLHKRVRRDIARVKTMMKQREKNT